MSIDAIVNFDEISSYQQEEVECLKQIDYEIMMSMGGPYQPSPEIMAAHRDDLIQELSDANRSRPAFEHKTISAAIMKAQSSARQGYRELKKPFPTWLSNYFHRKEFELNYGRD